MLSASQGHNSLAVSSVDWADSMGRSFHRIASCGADEQLRVHVVTSPRKLDGDKWRHDNTHRLQVGKKVRERYILCYPFVCILFVLFC